MGAQGLDFALQLPGFTSIIAYAPQFAHALAATCILQRYSVRRRRGVVNKGLGVYTNLAVAAGNPCS
jgi:hypothetical protein